MGTTTMDALNQGMPAASPPQSHFGDPADPDLREVGSDRSDGSLGTGAPPRLAVRRRLRARPGRALARAIAQEVVPLLVLAHRAPRPAASAPSVPSAAALAESVAVLARLAALNDVEAAVALIEDLHARGAPLDTLYLDVISAAARHLGQLWHEDRISFAEVTIGVLALQRLLHRLDHAFCFCADVVHRDPAKRVLLASRPGEPHGFAIDLIGAFLRRGGWEVATLVPANDAELCAAVRAGWYAVLGLSDSCGGETDAIAVTIHAARRASLNRHLRVMVGGPGFGGDPEAAIRVGADATATDARHAVAQAEALFALLGRDA